MVTAIIFSFFGKRVRVCWLNQRLSHTSRAYILHQEGLKGFVPLAERQTRMNVVFLGASIDSTLNDNTLVDGKTWKALKKEKYGNQFYNLCCEVRKMFVNLFWFDSSNLLICFDCS